MIRAIAACILLLASTPAFALEDADYSAAVAWTAKKQIIPAYQWLEDRTLELQYSLSSLCQNPSSNSLTQARVRFGETAEAWARIQFISFGPVALHQRAFRIEYWPDKRNVVGRQLAEVLKKQDGSALEPGRFATATVGIQGLPALERLLFEERALDLVQKDALGAAFRCRLLAAIATNLTTITNEIVAGWTEGDSSFLSRIENPSEDDEELPTGRDAAGRLLNDLLTAIIAIRDMKLLAPLGDNVEKAKPRSAEYWRSGQSIAVIEANVYSLLMLFDGERGLAGLLFAQTDGKIPAYQMLGAIHAMRNQVTALGNLNLPLHKIVADPRLRQRAEALTTKLAEMRDILVGRVAPKLNLPIGFNALDGD